jgi:hypothetical protein
MIDYLTHANSRQPYHLHNWMDLPLAAAVIKGAIKGSKSVTACTHRGWQAADITSDNIRTSIAFLQRPDNAGFVFPKVIMNETHEAGLMLSAAISVLKAAP